MSHTVLALRVYEKQSSTAVVYAPTAYALISDRKTRIKDFY
ncbi:hypothetical protein [Moraxella bovoculi]|nr:hypothetical protein [Moraxella bovoculi]